MSKTVVAAIFFMSVLAVVSGCDQNRQSPPASSGAGPASTKDSKSKPPQKGDANKASASSDGKADTNQKADIEAQQDNQQFDVQRSPDQSQNPQPPEAPTGKVPPAPPIAEIEKPTPPPPPAPQENQPTPRPAEKPAAPAPIPSEVAPSPGFQPSSPQNQVDIDTPQPFVVMLLGRVQSEDIKAIVEKIKATNHNPAYNGNVWLNEVPLKSGINVAKIQNLMLTQVSGREIMQVKEESERVPGLNLIFRPVQAVQATVTLKVRGIEDQTLATFQLGEARNTRDIKDANLNDPVSYLFTEDNAVLCRAVDAACIEHLRKRNFFENLQDKDVEGTRRETLSIRDIVADMIEKSQVALGQQHGVVTATTPNRRNNMALDLTGITLLKKFVMDKITPSGDREKTSVVKSLDLVITNVKMVELKDPQGEFPISAAYTANANPEAKGAYVYDVGNRYLYALPVSDPRPITNGISDQHLTESGLREYYTAIMGALK